MKIALATFPWAYFTPGGGEIQIEKLFEELKLKNIEVEKFNQWIPQKEFEIFHFFSCIGGSFDFCNYLKNINKKLLISSSLWITRDKVSEYPLEAIINQLRLADFIIVNSTMEKNILSDVTGINSQFFRVVHNGFDEKLLLYRNKIVEPPANIPQEWLGKYILCLANIEKRKNQNKLVMAARKLNKKLILVGNIRDYKYYDSLKIKDDDKNVIFCGHVNQKSKQFISLFKYSSCFVLPSKLETPGLAALEAAALGVPLIVTDEGSPKEYFGQIGSYYNGKVGNTDDLCDLIDCVIKTPQLGIVDLDQIKQFTWSKCAEEQINIYKELL